MVPQSNVDITLCPVFGHYDLHSDFSMAAEKAKIITEDDFMGKWAILRDLETALQGDEFPSLARISGLDVRP